MPRLDFNDSQLAGIRRELQEAAERLQRRKEQLPTAIAHNEARVEELTRELADVNARLELLIGDEAAGRPGLVVMMNQQIDLFAAAHPPTPSASLGRRGHPIPIASVRA